MVTNVPANETMDAPTDLATCAPTSAGVGESASAVVGAVMATPGDKTIGTRVIEITGTVLDVLQNTEVINEGVTTFLEAISPLMSALDKVAKIHPFIGGASSSYHTALIMKYPVQSLFLRSRPYIRSRRSDVITTIRF